MTDFVKDTRDWIRNVSDERAAAAGCRFHWQRGAFSVWWIERYCRLYEGDGYAGEPLVLWGCKQCDYSDFYAVTDPWWEDEECSVPGLAQAIHAERAAKFAECVKAGHDIDWQYDFQMRCYGWEKYRSKWQKFLRRFRKGSVWLAKKQKKSPTMAANSLYVFAGDNEPGQHVYLMAKDGQQAKKIAGEHAFQMLDQSEELSRECKTNMNEMSIYHFETRSTWEPLSSSNARTQKSKEGKNGSGFVDEAHVVDGAFINRVNRMGISRPEPLFLAFSTAGNDPDGWGAQEFAYAQGVIDGRVNNDEYLAIVYAAPQDLTDEELEADFDRYARMANPSMGHTIDPEEIRADYEQSKETIEKLAEFKMYRLNVWQHSSNPWLRPSDWAKCAAEYTEDDLLGRTCFCAFDLSLKWDTTAIVLAFPWGEADDGQPRYRLWPYFFLPQESARIMADKAPWREWHSKGFIRLTDGNTTDFPLVRRTINEISKKFDLQGYVAYDPRLAAYLAQHLQDEDQIPCEEFKQTPGDFFEPMGRFEADVIAGRIEHPNNSVLNWQAGNATKRKDGMLMKPTQDSSGKTEDRNKKIDGIVAAVMAVGRAATAEGSGPTGASLFLTA
jgi:phage terminase large subunit-like protein